MFRLTNAKRNIGTNYDLTSDAQACSNGARWGSVIMRLDEHSFFKLFDGSVAQQIMAIAEIEEFTEGQFVFREGDPPDSMYLVLAGMVDIVKIPAGGPVQVIAHEKQDDFFGEYGVLDGQNRSAGAVARGNVTIARLARDPILKVLNSAPGQCIMELSRHLINNIRTTNDKYIQDVVRNTKMTSIGQMLNTILHDFRNPFTVIRMAASVIPRTHPDESTVQMCKLIDEQIERVKIMTDEILEFSRGTAKIDKKRVKVTEVLQRFEFLNKDYLRQSNVDFVVRGVDTVLELDVNKILRVLQNLVNNAAEMFLQKGGGRIAVIAKDVSGGVGVEISVVDNGPGIPEPIRDRLFEPFATHGKEKGIGLGLAICKSLVEAHKGTITVNTATDKGTTFLIRFPLPDSA